MKTLSLILVVFLLVACRKETITEPQPAPVADSLYFPPITGPEWETTTPEQLGWNTSKLNDLYNFLQQNRTRAFLILKNGKIVLEQYFGKNIQGTSAFNQNSFWYWASAGKTLTAFTVGKAQQEGFLQIGNKTSQYLGTGWTSAPLDKEQLITVQHQLSMTAGLDDGTGDADNTAPAALIYKANSGTRWAYHNAPYTLLQQVVSNATGQPFTNYFDKKLKSQIGMDGQWINDGDNHVYWSTARSMARFGLLMLAKATWNGKDILGDSVFYKASVNSSQNINPSYGYLWWLNGKTSFMVPQSQFVVPGSISPNAPADMVSGMGKNAQVLNVVSSQGLVVVRMGDDPYTSALVSIEFSNNLWDRLRAIIN